jgi:WD40 repeat protein
VQSPGALIYVYSVPRRQAHLIRPTHKSYLNYFAVSADGELLATYAWDGQVKLWDVQSGRELTPPLRGQRIGFTALAFSPDGSRLAGGGYDGTITVWDLSTHQQVGNWRAHGKQCSFLSFIDAGSTLISVGTAPLGDSMTQDTGCELQLRAWHSPPLEQLTARR